MTGCQDTDGNDNPPAPETVTYTGEADGKTYTLTITENTSRAVYTPQKGDTYVLTVETKISSGTVTLVTDGGLTLQPSAETAVAFTISVSSDGITAITGTITFDNGEKESAPASIEPDGNNAMEAAKTITITGLGEYNGSMITVALLNDPNELMAQNDSEIDIDGNGKIANGTVTIQLYIYPDDKPWTGTGSYYIVFAVESDSNMYGDETYVSAAKVNFNSADTSIAFSNFKKYAFSFKINDFAKMMDIEITNDMTMNEWMIASSGGGTTTYKDWSGATGVKIYTDEAMTQEITGSTKINNVTLYININPHRLMGGGENGAAANTPAVDNGTTIAGMPYSDKDNEKGSRDWSRTHYIFSPDVLGYNAALNLLTTAWGNPDETENCSIQSDSNTSNTARQNGCTLLEVNNLDYRLAVWEQNNWKTVIWNNFNDERVITDENGKVNGYVYIDKGIVEGTFQWDTTNYLLSISYAEALSILTALWGQPGNNYGLQARTLLSDQAYDSGGVIFEDTLWDYRLCCAENGKWEVVGWRKNF